MALRDCGRARAQVPSCFDDGRCRRRPADQWRFRAEAAVEPEEAAAVAATHHQTTAHPAVPAAAHPAPFRLVAALHRRGVEPVPGRARWLCRVRI